MVAWIEAYAQIIGFFAQILFWIAVGVSALWASSTFSRYVKFMTSDEPSAAESTDEINVDEFVE
jgi:hypothetical protein